MDRFRARLPTGRGTWMVRAACLLVALVGQSFGVGYAKDLVLTRTAQSGTPSRIAYERSWNKACQALGSQVTITSQPAHGTVSVVAGQSVIPATTPREGSTGRCAGQPITGNEIIYQSQPGYHGTDHVSWSVVYGSGGGGRTDMTVVVQ